MAGAMDSVLLGAIDLHAHVGASPFPRRLNLIDAVRHYDEAGFRGFVAKSHHHLTVMDIATLDPSALRGVSTQVFGGIVLNSAVGGFNAHAVDLAVKMGGRVVWFPTLAASNDIEWQKTQVAPKRSSSAVTLMPEKPLDIFSEEGDLRREVGEVLGVVQEADIALGSGHMSVGQTQALFENARAIGINRMFVNHPNSVVGATPRDGVEIAEMGVYMEHLVCMYDEDSTFFQWPLTLLLEWINAVGPNRTILASGLGQANNPLPADSLRKIGALLLDSGVSEKDLRTMTRSNPGYLLNLEE